MHKYVYYMCLCKCKCVVKYDTSAYNTYQVHTYILWYVTKTLLLMYSLVNFSVNSM